MTVDEAIRHLYTYSSTNGSGQTTDTQHEEAKQMGIKALKAQQWIPCSERLPYADSESGRMLATCGHRDVKDARLRWIMELYFIGGVWRYPTGETYEQKVYAWMPRPKPWKGEQP